LPDLGFELVDRREGENRLVLKVLDEGASAYLSTHFAYCTPEIGSQMHRQRGFWVRMNDKPITRRLSR
jgi:hypothetical protein